jgi:adenine deaminase
MALEGMEVAELLLYLAGIASTLAAAYVASSYLQLKGKSKGT